MGKIKKIEVIEGVFWVEIPDAGLYTLCAAPEDSIKHLMKRGLIVSMEKAGVACESGPNAILLSDVMLQNGHVSNLAEFPVLQMLYRQGMILPDHPNNTGRKPLLMGLREQIDAQMRYIFRGNYGLTSEQELVEAGLSPSEARAQFRIKLKFAFGAIQPPNELLDTRVVESREPVEIINGVTLARLGLNLYEFQYKGERVTVDLNLTSGSGYASPYPLGFHDIRREYFGVIHSGEGDGWDVNRPSMSSVLMFQGRIYLVDAGPNVAHGLTRLGIGLNEIEGIFHTHCHDDHFAGLSTLIRAGHRIKYFATPTVRASVAKKLAALLSMDEERFSDFFDMRTLREGVWNNVDGMKVKPIHSPHPVETTVFFFRAMAEDGPRTYAHLADVSRFSVLRGMVTDKADGPGIDSERCEAVIEELLQPVYLKKIDVGGGMIHGTAANFAADRSKKIVLAHLARQLTDAEKEIGSSAPFGIVDVLIPTRQEYAWRDANDYLRSYFPMAPAHDIRSLLNSDIVTFSPGTILVKAGEAPSHVFLLISGSVEMIQSGAGINHTLSAGALIGELTGLAEQPSTHTFRANSFVRVLSLSMTVFRAFISENSLGAEINLLRENRAFMRETDLFGGPISYLHQNRIAQHLAFVQLEEGAQLDETRERTLYLIKSGDAGLYIGQTLFERLEKGDCFGEGMAVFGMPGPFHLRAGGRLELAMVPGELLEEIPDVRWRLLETWEKRRRMILTTPHGDLPIFQWRPEYGINVQEIDIQHQRILDLAGLVRDALESGSGREATLSRMDRLIAYSRSHFADEETLLHTHAYPELEAHRREHGRLLERIGTVRASIDQSRVDRKAFVGFFHDWIISHILSWDRTHGVFLNGKGVY